MSVLPPQNILLSIRRRGQGLGAGGTRVPPLPAVLTWSAGDDDLVPFSLGPLQRGSQLDPVPGAALSPRDHSAAVSDATGDGVGGTRSLWHAVVALNRHGWRGVTSVYSVSACLSGD